MCAVLRQCEREHAFGPGQRICASRTPRPNGEYRLVQLQPA